ncbi:hypothetical protein A3L04_05290 [Thermococcus chitonophagus]|nr:hypothetical protein [Thermococcus chitonophagus]ASJ16529.1 hypothetical protein A3L04_05290 [Thermococcus chitonophagus]
MDRVYGLILMKFSNSRMQAVTLAKVFGWLHEMFLNQGNTLIALAIHVLWVFALVFISRTS